MSDYNRPDDLGTVLRTLVDRLERLERSRRFKVPVVSADPESPNDGDMWIQGTNLKVQIGGVTKTVTLT